MEFYTYYKLGKRATEEGLFDGTLNVYSFSTTLMFSGNPDSIIAGILMFIGMTSIILGGLWKLIVKILGRKVIEILS